MKNDNNVLPLKNRKINVFGYSSININFGGTGSGAGSDKYNVGSYDGLNNAKLKALYLESYKSRQKTNVMVVKGEICR